MENSEYSAQEPEIDTGSTMSKRDKKKNKQAEKKTDILDQRMEDFMEHKNAVPAPTVIHDNPNPLKNDIILHSV
jgi:hypothetical protein